LFVNRHGNWVLFLQIKKRTMSRIFITGSADGLGKMAAQSLVADGHKVVLHARDTRRANDAMSATPGAEGVIVGDLSSINETIKVAEQVNALGSFDAVINNAGIGYRESKRITTTDGLAQVFAVNALAPYILTCLINRPKRLVFISSGLHRQGDPSLNDIAWQSRPWSGFNAYADSKLYNVILAFAIAGKWPDVLSNALEPGWVATKMGGPGAPDNMEDAIKTQTWLATSSDDEAIVTGQYFYHKKLRLPNPSATKKDIQEKFLEECQRFSGISFPG
jgi:NAD(P)-dependent dehydrogenase (short-subunit alcohol dehydrogenase family)